MGRVKDKIQKILEVRQLPSSGAITLDEIHVEAGGTSGTECSINDADIRSLISASAGSTMSFSDFYGASAGPRSSGRLTVGETSEQYPKRGAWEDGVINITNGTMEPAAGTPVWPIFTPSLAGGPIEGARIRGISFWTFPAAGNPSVTMWFDIDYVNPYTDDRLRNLTVYFRDQNGTQSLDFPIGKDARANSSSPANFNGGLYTANGGVYNAKDSWYWTSRSSTPLWNGVDSSVGAQWYLGFNW